MKNVPKLLRHFTGEEPIKPIETPDLNNKTAQSADFSEVKGQENVKRALEVAAAGGYNILKL